MMSEKIKIGTIPSIVFGEPSDHAFVYVHGRYSCKEEAESFAKVVTARNYQVISFDLPEHGERKEENYLCTVQNGVRDLKTVFDGIAGQYRSISLFACSLGAYFSLMAYGDLDFRNCLFLSPILDMERLIQNMMKWSCVTEEQLRKAGEIETSFGERLSWEYYEYVRQHRIHQWDSPTSILYGENDYLTERSVLESFAARFNCRVTVMDGGEHYFHTAHQLEFLDRWINDHKY